MIWSLLKSWWTHGIPVWNKFHPLKNKSMKLLIKFKIHGVCLVLEIINLVLEVIKLVDICPGTRNRMNLRGTIFAIFGTN